MDQPAPHSADVAALRRDYALGGLEEADAAADPMTMFARWFAEVRAAGLTEPNAMVVATVSAQGRPSSRTVLLKGFDGDGFRFFTNLGSHKAVDLAASPWCSLLLPWHDLERQVRADGVAELLPRADVEAYFASRPRGSQLGAWASPQSTVVAGRDELAATYADVEARFAGRDVPPPDGWGGYLVRPDVVEFWQGRPSRMHDRLVYRRPTSPDSVDGWLVERLAP